MEGGNQPCKGRLATPSTFHGLPRVVGFCKASAKLNSIMPVTPTIKRMLKYFSFDELNKRALLCRGQSNLSSGNVLVNR
ncbi:hypothetical protein SADUNF_Sadunf13G0112300 [Salix dunnii]|uniref:Uncharacterized protein n=1 Tax=Salix dunnii TaxID=1413687 RepID=A0A835JLX9_9ROSI|nr:hypothetical protein SADUNF_Sadunf13G0112300 [Salix dunnii]